MKRFLSLFIASLVLCLVLVSVTGIPAAATVTTCDIAVLEVGLYTEWAADDFSQLDVPPGVEAYTWTTISEAELTSGLAAYDVLIVPWHHDYAWLDDSKAGAIVAWVNSGGRLIVHNYLFEQPLNNDPLMAAFGSAYNVDWTGEDGIYSGDSVQIVDPANPLATTPNLLSVAGLSNWHRTVHNSINPATAGSAWMWAMSSVDTGWYWLGYALAGGGVIVVCGGDPEFHSPAYPEATKLIENEIICTFIVTVDVDIKPGSDPNSINLRSNGVVPLAILTTDNFDASTVDPSTVVFAGAEPVRYTMEDVDGDGDLDMLFHFNTQELVLASASTEATLTGETFDGAAIEGTDSVKIPKGSK